ncbi:two-component sensor histidine kinase [Candidatus Magnetoovum chiemensis]|nr:two-component sensor histidine kinase [Candidatus Magnetoovum chiemensis]
MKNIIKKFSITSKMFITTISTGIAVWVLLDYISMNIFTAMFQYKLTKEEMQTLVSINRIEIAITSFVFIISFTLIVCAIANYIRRFIKSISDFSESTLGKKTLNGSKGDELYILRSNFNRLAEEIIRARESLMRETEERVQYAKKAMEAEIRTRELNLFRSVMEIMQIGVAEIKYDKLITVNKTMEELANKCGGIHLFLIESEGECVELEFYEENSILCTFYICRAIIKDIGEYLLVHDITKLKQAEGETLSMAKFPQENPNPVLRISSEGALLYSNKKAAAVLEFFKRENQEELLPNVSQAFITDVLKSGINKSFEITAGNSTFLFAITPIVEAGYVNLYGIDITELKKTETMLKAKQEEISMLNLKLQTIVEDEVGKNRQKDLIMLHQSRLASMGEMIGHIAHQWRQPLNALNILIYNIKDSYELGEFNDEFLETAVNEGRLLIEKMSSTIDDFRNFFNPNKEKERFCINKTIKDTLSLIKASFVHYEIEVRYQETTDICTYGFPNEYSQVLLNLLNNAKDAIIDNKIRNGTIRISCLMEDGYAALKIQDNGGGIPQTIINKIFDPYFTTKEQGKGTGLGLYMAKMIIESHMNGKLEARNNTDGAEFIIKLPLLLDSA